MQLVNTLPIGRGLVDCICAAGVADSKRPPSTSRWRPTIVAVRGIVVHGSTNLRGSPPTMDPDFVQVLACPQCGSTLHPHSEERLDCTGCSLTYPVEARVPMLL